MRYKIGYIDEDKDQVIKYERKLRNKFDLIGYDIYQGLTLNHLIDQVYNSNVDLLMIDYFLVDKGILTYNGDEVVRAYEEIRPQFPMIIFTNEEAQAFPRVDNPNIIYDKALAATDLDYFTEVLTKNIEIHKNYINKRKETINNLMEKAEKQALNPHEKHTLIECQIELNNLDKRSIELPFQYYNEHELEDLTKKIKDAEDFLNNLINNSQK